MKELCGKVALITGSSSGIGAAIALNLSELGANVVITGRDEKRIAEVVQKCQKVSGAKAKSIGVKADLTKDDEVKLLVDKTVQEFGRIDIFVSNAGFIKFATILSPDYVSVFDELFALKVRSVQVLTKLVVPYLIESKGNFVNISGIGSKIPYSPMTAYEMTVCATDMFTKCLALELGPKGVRCNTIICGIVTTGIIGEHQDYLVEYCKQNYPLQRVCGPEDVAELVAFVVSTKAHFITGAEIPIDSGHLIGSLPINQVFKTLGF